MSATYETYSERGSNVVIVRILAKHRSVCGDRIVIPLGRFKLFGLLA